MIYFVRHGETDFNLFNISQGQLDTSLNALGLKQAKQLAKKLKNKNFDAFYSSPLIRAKQTAEEINGFLKMKINYDARLMEVGKGILQGNRNSQKKYNKFFKNPHKYGGETEEDVEQTLDLMRKVKYESAMMYYYNPREGTPAAKMEQLPEQVRKDRLQRVIDLQLEHTHEQMSKRVGSVMKVLVESVSRDDKTELLGQTEQHEKVAFKAERSLIGKFVNVKITELSGNTFRGNIDSW